jgi:hypothetical protein
MIVTGTFKAQFSWRIRASLLINSLQDLTFNIAEKKWIVSRVWRWRWVWTWIFIVLIWGLLIFWATIRTYVIFKIWRWGVHWMNDVRGIHWAFIYLMALTVQIACTILCTQTSNQLNACNLITPWIIEMMAALWSH